MSGKRRPDTEEEGIARGKHDDGAAAKGQHRLHRTLERALPSDRLASDERCGEYQVPCTTEDDRRIGNQSLGAIAKSGWTVLAEADKSEPAFGARRLNQAWARPAF